MTPKNLRFGGGLSETVLHPYIAVAMLAAIALILIVPRKKAIIPFLLAFFSIPVGQVLVISNIHLNMLQILILVVLGRMAAFRSSSEKRFSGGFNTFDKLVVAYTLVSLLIFNIEFRDMQAFIKGLGDLIICLGAYLAVRFLIPDRHTMRLTFKVLAVICVVQGATMASELFTAQNIFYIVGANQPVIREGHVRAEGALGTLYGGAMAGALIPFFLWLWTEKSGKLAAVAGILGATAMVYASHASTSWMTYAASLLGLAFWPLRKYMRVVRWGLVTTLVALHLAMQGPVWSLIAKIDITGGSSSYHRYYLVDNCIRHFSDWWLIGCTNYGDWGFDMWDLCNQFVAAALTGGLITLILYLMIFQRTFRDIGLARKRVQGDKRQEWLFWCLGAALFSNVVAHFGINYMYHLSIYFWILLVCISVSTLEVLRSPKPATVPTVKPAAKLEFAPPQEPEPVSVSAFEPQRETPHLFDL